MTEPTTFKVSWGDHEVQVEGRQAAVDFAKSKSLEVSPQSVAVDSVGDEKSSTIAMTYSSGHLEVYVAETRSPERRTRKRERTDEETTGEGSAIKEETSTESDAPVESAPVEMQAEA